RAKQVDIGDIVACILDRPRHTELIQRVRATGARIMLISDGDVSGVISTSRPDSGVDIYLGSGGAPEGVLAAGGPRRLRRPKGGRPPVPPEGAAGRGRACGRPRPCAASAARCRAACCSATRRRRAAPGAWA